MLSIEMSTDLKSDVVNFSYKEKSPELPEPPVVSFEVTLSAPKT